jgi:hypothetical protein
VVFLVLGTEKGSPGSPAAGLEGSLVNAPL